MHIIRRLGALVLAVAAFAASPAVAHDAPEHDIHKVAIQVSDNDPGTMTKVLNVAANLSRGFLEKGEDYEIEIVAYNAGLHLLRTDTSPEAKRMASFPSSVPNVTFSAVATPSKV